MANKKPLSAKEGVQLEEKASAVTYNEQNEGLIYNNNDTEIRTQINGADREVVTDTETQSLTNKTIDGDLNTITNIGTAELKDGEVTTAKLADDAVDKDKIAADVAGDGLAQNVDGSLEVNVDDSTVEIATDTLQVKDSGITDAKVAAGIDAAKLADGTVSNTELQYINSLSSNAQDQIDAKTDDTVVDAHIIDAVGAHAGSAISNTPAGNLAATDVQGALNELQSDVDTRALDSALTDHINDATDAHAGSAITNTPAGNLAATDVQGALNELQTDVDTRALDSALTDHINDASDAHAGSAITNTPSGNLAATDVQGALNELQTDVDGRALETGTPENTFSIGDNLDTNKTIEFDNGDTNNPAIRFNATSDALEFANDGVTFSEFGSGSGGGGLDTFYTEDFETTLIGSIDSGNNATFLGAGALVGTLAYETVSPISGTQSLKYTQASGSLNDYIALPAITLDDKEKGNDLGFVQYFTYDGDANDIKVVVYDVANSRDLTDSLALYTDESNPTRFTLQVFVPTNATTLRVGFQVKVENIGTVLVVDDIEGSSNPFIYKDLYNVSDLEDYTPTITGFGTPSSVDVKYRRDGDMMEIYGKFTSGTATGVEAQIGLPSSYTIDSTKNATIKTVGQFTIDSTSTIQIFNSLSTGGDTYLNIGARYGSGSGLTPLNGSGIAINGEVVSFYAKVPISGWTSETAAVVHSSTGTENTFSARIANSGTASITSQSGGDNPAIASVNRTGVGTVDVTFTSGFFSTTPTINVTIQNAAAGSGYVVNTYGESATGFTYKSTDPGVGALDKDVDIIIQNQGSDYKLPNAYAVTPLTRTAYIKDVKASGTDGGTFTSGAWQTRTLNTLSGDSSFVSLSSNQFTLPAGKYEIEVTAPAYYINRHQAKVINITDTVEYLGSSEYANVSVTTHSTVKCTTEINDTKTFEIQHQCQSTDVNGLGIAVSFGNDEIYTQVKITKIL